MTRAKLFIVDLLVYKTRIRGCDRHQCRTVAYNTNMLSKVRLSNLSFCLSATSTLRIDKECQLLLRQEVFVFQKRTCQSSAVILNITGEPQNPQSSGGIDLKVFFPGDLSLGSIAIARSLECHSCVLKMREFESPYCPVKCYRSTRRANQKLKMSSTPFTA